MAHGAGDRSTRVLIVFVVFPTCLVVFSFLALIPLGSIASFLPVGGEKALPWVIVAGYLLGGAGALWVCRFAWPNRSKSRRDKTSAS